MNSLDRNKIKQILVGLKVMAIAALVAIIANVLLYLYETNILYFSILIIICSLILEIIYPFIKYFIFDK